ncbi:MAG TPA: pentapeptide repeat-containing protein [Chloroflexota bacterium]|nr:pentapeptide repeat-containing protein [Chloroflexota bacterium]
MPDNKDVRGSSNDDNVLPGPRAKKGWFVRATAAEAAAVTAEERRRHGPSRILLALLLLAVLASLALWYVPQLQVYPARERLSAETQVLPGERLVLENDLFQAENSARSTLALIFAAAGLLLGLGIAWRRYEISRELRTHERFARAVEQLASERADGSPRMESRLGGIYALERLAADSEREYWPVMEVLTAYVRENAAWRPIDHAFHASGATVAASSGPPHTPSADIQAILAVLGRRKPHAATVEKRLLDLRGTDLRGANLSGSRLDGMTLHGAHLEQVDATRAILTRSNLREASLAGASLTEVDLEGASLSHANLEGARLNGANLKAADLSGANLGGADLWEANLKGCNLKDADLRGSDLSQCVLDEAILWRADLQDAVLNGARLRRAHLERANLSGATGLTWEQGDDAFTDENTILPEYLQPEQARRTGVEPAPQFEPKPPTPAERRTPRRRAPLPLALPAAVEPKDNVVELQAAAERRAAPLTRARTLRQAQVLRQVQDERALIQEEQAHPKKASLPKHRKQDLVKPA